MTRKLVQTGSSLAVTLPKEVVDQFKLKKGDPVEVSVHPQTGAIVVRTAVRYIEGGKVTKRFNERAQKVMAKYDKAFQALASDRRIPGRRTSPGPSRATVAAIRRRDGTARSRSSRERAGAASGDL